MPSGINVVQSLAHIIATLTSELDKHSGSALALLTAIYAIGTFLMWWEMRGARLKADEPSVQISLEPRARSGNFFDLVISNIGNVPVYKFRISIYPSGLETIGKSRLEDLNLFKRTFPVFGKGTTLRTLAISYVDFIHSAQPKQITLIATYYSSYGKKYEQHFDFDMEIYMNMSAPSENNLNDVVSKLAAMTNEISKVARYITNTES